MKKRLIIYGPTATGKTALALQLARKFQGELISADSRQVYQNLDITTGKASFKSKVEKHKGFWIVDGVKIHGFDLVEPPRYEPDSSPDGSLREPGSEQGIFSVSDFLKFASDTMIQIIVSKKLPIVVGGTGFYIKALLDGIGSVGIPSDLTLRRELEKLSIDHLYQKLEKIDPKRAKSMNESDRQNPRRLIRAIEIARASYLTPGVSGVASKRTPGVSLDGEYQIIGLTAPNSYLYSRADKWLKTRLEHGMIDEVKSLLDQKVSHQWLDDLGLECRWITRYLLGKVSREEAINRLRGDIHSFIRRQKTWFRKFPQLALFDISKPNWQQELEKLVSHPV